METWVSIVGMCINLFCVALTLRSVIKLKRLREEVEYHRDKLIEKYRS